MACRRAPGMLQMAALVWAAACSGANSNAALGDAAADSAALPSKTADAAGDVKAAVVDAAVDASVDVPSKAIDAAAPSDVASSDAALDVAARAAKVDRSGAKLYEFRFKPSTADPTASLHDLEQYASLDTRVAPRGRLVIVLAGKGGAPGPLSVAKYAAGRGFHTFAVAYENDYNITQNDAATFGNARLEAFDGVDRTTLVAVKPADSIATRTAKALQHLQSMNPGGDWGYYLDAAGGVRWSDVIVTGHSHGASGAACIATVVALARVVSLSGPRDTSPVVATWLSGPLATPLDRLYGFTGTIDPQHPDHLLAMQTRGYVGTPTNVEQTQPPYGGSHRLVYSADHGDSADPGKYEKAYDVMFGVGP